MVQPSGKNLGTLEQQYIHPHHVEGRRHLPAKDLQVSDRRIEQRIYRIIQSGTGDPITASGTCAVLVSIAIIETFRRTVKRNEEKLKWAMKEHEKQTYEEKVRFLINISHELRTPLTLIHAPLNRILKSLSSEDPQYRTQNGGR